MDKYNVFENEIYIAACMLNPNYFNFNYASEEEKRKFYAIGKTYIQEVDKKVNPNSNVAACNTANTSKSHDSFFGEDIEEEEIGTNLEKEMIDLNNVQYNGTISNFWNTRKETFPKLYSIAKYIITCHATSVPSERLFSSSSDQIWPKRNMLSDDMFERIVLIQKNI